MQQWGKPKEMKNNERVSMYKQENHLTMRIEGP